MTASNSSIAPLDVSKLAKRTRTASVMTLVGALIVASSMFYSYRQLSKLQKERDMHLKILADLTQKEEDERKRFTEFQDRSTKMANSIVPVQRGLQCFFRKDYAGAIEHYNEALTIDDKNPVLFDLRGYALLRKARSTKDAPERDRTLREAIQSSEQSVKLDPKYEWGHYNLALAYWQDKKHEQAVDEVRIFFGLEPKACEIILDDCQFNEFADVAAFGDLMKPCKSVSTSRRFNCPSLVSKLFPVSSTK